MTNQNRPSPHHGIPDIYFSWAAHLKDVPSLRVLLWSLVVGLLSGFLGGVFRICLTRLGGLRYSLVSWVQPYSFLDWMVPMLYSGLMAFGALLLVRRFAPETAGSGVHEIEGAMEGLRPLRWRRVLPVKFLGGLMSLGAGLAVGPEGPTIQMCGSLGKMVADKFRVSGEDVNTLLAAGVGAGLSAAFNAPLSAVLFVIEEMRPQFKYSVLSVQSVLIASGVADIVVRMLTGQGPVISMEHLPSPHLSVLWIFVVFGAVFGILGLIFNRLLLVMLDFFSKMRGLPYTLTGLYVGAFIGLLGLLNSSLIGSGYDVIPRAMDTAIPATALLVIFIARFGTTTLCYGSGVPGGIFAPMLALGTLLGMWFGHFAHAWFPEHVIHPSIFGVAGMGALFAATVRAPLTGICLAVELTGNYEQILPLILTCMAATVVAEGLRGKPIENILLKRTLSMERRKAQEAQVMAIASPSQETPASAG